MAHTGQHLAGQGLVVSFMAQTEGLPQMRMSIYMLTCVVRHPAGQVVEFCGGSEEIGSASAGFGTFL